ncbi:MAG: ferrous iron transport protein B [Oscillospiraceae bacterium]|jgi:ferrous iron transport protein B|nr:ferrous iron transport protein B [Oscillospiraceae bacterium]
MPITIALAGNPNSGKTTLFNALTGSNQFVGNWPGVTVEKKEGKLRGQKDVTITDLPGIYSLSPYTLEEVVSRNYLIDARPDAILNIVDGTNLERNLFLTTQLTELGIPVVVAVNMTDIVAKNGDKINVEQLSKELGCRVIEISALKGTGVTEAANAAVEAAKSTVTVPQHGFSGSVEHALAHIEEAVLHELPPERQRFFAIKLFERDAKIIEKLGIAPERVAHIEDDIKACEAELDDDAESIITAERYTYIDSIIKDCVKVKNKGKLTVSDKIDRIVTNRIAALPIFAAVMFIVYFVSVTTVGTIATDWANDGLFGDGWYPLGIGRGAYDEAVGEYDVEQTKIEAYIEAAEEAGIDTAPYSDAIEAGDEAAAETALAYIIAEAGAANLETVAVISGEDGETEEEIPVALADFEAALAAEEPDPADSGPWIPGVPALIGGGLDSLSNGDDAIGEDGWLRGLILDGIVAGVGAVLGFVPQILILFVFLAFLESCGYMARIAFIMDRIFRRFGLSGKSFIPILIGTGCGIPGIMASRTIESDRDRKMTIMTTTFIPCSAKLPIIALIAGALFRENSWWVGPSAYFIGIAAIICSGVILKKTKIFAGDASPFVMELPSYHMPTVGAILRSTWERGWSFIKKAGTIILLATVFVWFTSSFGFADGGFGMVDMNDSILAKIGGFIAPVFIPLGWGEWKSAVAAITGLIAKENVVGTFGILFRPDLAEVAEDGAEIWDNLKAAMPALAGYSFLVFNLLCAPCFAAMGAIKREMNSRRWFWTAIGYQCLFAYVAALCVFQLGSLFTGTFGAFTIVAFILVAAFIFLLLRPAKRGALAARSGV